MNICSFELKIPQMGQVIKNKGSGAKKLNDLKIFFQTWPYWYYYLKKVRDQDGKRKHIQMETLSSRHDFVDCTLVPAVQPKLS
ncbi:hypothetical protein [Bacillus thuringiensis]|uniref:hypothetical protein n=1 Tax=Bacillus thuringiensis TaxID=1428 RepID=UPI000A388A9C|nr:hypothetical protein [Bacillus thuringiensis]MEC3103687.1 hypothetical protein [Bacillus thuringiensis]MEC3178885.1 hypothetical protein [Bacillus thuringiensis]MEC3529977.1 hypothetical protein [Bacillus thuringiensis]MED3171836.1 hypothetical protein [Bacillus thuringiensis]MED3263199.1 hypothetical protein [Bacillus thuringiensis]